MFRGLLPGGKQWLPETALDGDEHVRLDISPLHETSAPVKLSNRTHIWPAELSMPLREAATLLRRSPTARGFHAYVQQFPLSRGPALTASLPLQRALYLASRQSHLVAVNFWLGDGGLRSALHYDKHDVLLVQLRGSKTVLLFPPNVSEGVGLYAPYAERRYTFDTGEGRFAGHRASGGAPVENHATVDVFAPTSEASSEGGGGAAAAEEAAAVAAAQLEQRIEQLVNASRCVLFMKGSPTTPRCGFSRQVAELLDAGAVPYSTFDILTDDAVRQGLKKVSDWPTYPQLYANGELIGGLDILREMAADGDLLGQLDLQAEEVIEKAMDPLTARLTALVEHAPVMLFMKGKPGAEQCGFSRTICALLTEHHIAFDSFDILTDDAVRQGLKKFSDWPTFPQLYVNGDLAGGLDILTEMAADGDLKTQLLG